MAKVIIFSGAGISAESGISTFRDSGGLWDEYKIEDICSASCMQTNRDKTIEFYDKRRIELEDKQPNKAHKQIKKIKDKYPDEITIITQNVDNLFEKAGCKDVMHLHGFMTSIYCKACDYKKDIGYKKQRDAYTLCPKCKKDMLRPDIVFFGEQAPMYKKAFKEIDNCEFLVIIGTSGNVINTYMFLNPKIKHSILNNLEPSDAIDDKLYSKVLYKKVSLVINETIEDIENFIKEVR